MNRVTYEIEKDYEGTWHLITHKYMEIESPAQGVEMIRALYVLEDKEKINVTVKLSGNEAVDQLFK